MTNTNLKTIQKTIDYQFDNEDLLQQAFTRRSYTQENGGENNEVLEFIGDKALDLVVIKELMTRFSHITDGDYAELKTKYNEGEFTKIKKDLVESKTLANSIDILGFNEYLIMGKGDIKNNVQENDSVMEDLFEAIVGAVAIDSNWDLDAIENVCNMMLDFDDYFNHDGYDIEYVGEIQEWSQKRNNALPQYDYYNVYGGYRCTLRLDGISYQFMGEAKRKSAARLLAAKSAYEYLMNNGMLYTLEDEVGSPDEERAINQLQELYQKGYINEPIYEIYENHNSVSNNDVWICAAYLKNREHYGKAVYSASSKKIAKKAAAYDLLQYIFNEYRKNKR